MSFASTALERIADLGPLCAGIDPHPQLLQSWNLHDDAAGLREFTQRTLEGFAPEAAAIKFQVALFERLGAAGFAVLEEALRWCRELGVPSIADAKRGDIGSTMSAYAAAWLSDASPLAADALTVSPYLGYGSLAPAIKLAQDSGRGLFVLAATSNPEGAQVQRAVDKSGGSVAAAICAQAIESNAGFPANTGAVGLVIGATIVEPQQLFGGRLAELNSLILSPGFGAQGASAQQVRERFASNAGAVLVNSSRQLVSSGHRLEDVKAAARAAQDSLREK